jgi:hypothetical protein
MLDWDEIYIEVEERWASQFEDENGREPTEAERTYFQDDMGPSGLSERARDHYADMCDRAHDMMKER